MVASDREQLLVERFIAAISSHPVFPTVRNADPTSLQQAVSLATRAASTAAIVQAHSGTPLSSAEPPPAPVPLAPSVAHSQSHASLSASSASVYAMPGRGRGLRGMQRPRSRGPTLPPPLLRRPASSHSRRCYTCDGEGHMAAQCTSREGDFHTCYSCHGVGHMSRDCPNGRGAPRQ